MAGPQPRLHLPFAHWPLADRRLWQDAVQDDDPFSDAPGAQLAKTTLHRLCMGWRRFLGFLTIAEAMALEIAPAERVTIERVRRFADHLAETNTPHSVAIQIDALYGAARTMMPERDWGWLRTVKARLYLAAGPKGPSGPVITSMQLVDLGQQLMTESTINPSNTIKMADALRYRDGLMIALLGLVPLRHKNFAAIEIDRDLLKEGKNWFLAIPPEDTKTKIALDFPVPEFLQPYLATYLDHVRPRLLRRPTCRALWVSAKGGALSYSAVGPVFTRHTTQRLGIRISPHDARDAAATTWAIHAPDQIGVARDLLTHTDLRTTTRHYNRARGIEASRTHARLLARLRRRRKVWGSRQKP
jgi:integrase/recombinase XerD